MAAEMQPHLSFAMKYLRIVVAEKSIGPWQFSRQKRADFFKHLIGPLAPGQTWPSVSE
jgi:hypothetical protein